MRFTDQSHINRVRDALWQHSGSRASVMVGSGFSRNSVPIGPQVGTLPTWREVTNQLQNELYPHEDNVGNPDQLRIAQEYEAAFGRGALHHKLRQIVRMKNTVLERHISVCCSCPGRMSTLPIGTPYLNALAAMWQDVVTASSTAWTKSPWANDHAL